MENYEFEHRDPMMTLAQQSKMLAERMQAPLPAHYLRMPQSATNPLITGVPGSDMEQMVAANLTKPREQYLKSMYGQWNPVWEHMMDQAPKDLRGTLKNLMKSGLGSEASRRFMTDPALQQYIGAGGMQDALASERLLSFGGSLGARFTGNASNIMDLHRQQLQGAAQYQGGLMNAIYKQDPTNPNSKTLPGGNMNFTGGLGAADTMKLGGYLSKFGVGPMSNMNMENGVDQNKDAKVAYTGKAARALSEFMKIAGSSEIQQALQQFKQLEGREFATVDPSIVLRKMNTVSRIAALTGASSNQVLKMQSFGEGMMGAATGTGPGTRYTGPSSDLGGYVSEGVHRAAALNHIWGITDEAEGAKTNEAVQMRAAKMLNTLEGRGMMLASSSAAAGNISREDFETLNKTAASGGDMRGAFRAIEGKYPHADFLEQGRTDTGFRAGRARDFEDEVHKLDVRRLTNPQLNAELVRVGGSSNQARMDRWTYDEQTNKAMAAGFRWDANRITSSTAANKRARYAYANQADRGQTFTTGQEKDMADRAAGSTINFLKSKDSADIADRGAFREIIENGLKRGDSPEEIEATLRSSGGPGASIVADNYKNARSLERVKNTSGFSAKVLQAHQLEIKNLGIRPGASGEEVISALEKMKGDEAQKLLEEMKKGRSGSVDTRVKSANKTFDEGGAETRIDETAEDRIRNGDAISIKKIDAETQKKAADGHANAGKGKGAGETGKAATMNMTGTLKLEWGNQTATLKNATVVGDNVQNA